MIDSVTVIVKANKIVFNRFRIEGIYMKLTNQHLEVIVNKVLKSWKDNNLIEFKADEKKVFSTMLEGLKAELQKEFDLDREVNLMLDKLEQSNSGEFQRFKMFPMLKQKLAKEKKVIL